MWRRRGRSYLVLESQRISWIGRLFSDIFFDPYLDTVPHAALAAFLQFCSSILMYTAIGRRRDVPCHDARQRCAPTVTRHGLACTLGAPLHATFKRPTRARVHDVQARQETAFVLTPWEQPSRDTVARPHSQRGCPASRSCIHRAILGEGYSSPSELNFTLLASSSLDVWTVNDLIVRVGTVGRSAALEVLFVQVDHGALREETENRDVQWFCLLEHAPEDAGSAPVGMTTAGSRTALTDEEPAVSGRTRPVRGCWGSLRGGN